MKCPECGSTYIVEIDVKDIFICRNCLTPLALYNGSLYSSLAETFEEIRRSDEPRAQPISETLSRRSGDGSRVAQEFSDVRARRTDIRELEKQRKSFRKEQKELLRKEKELEKQRKKLEQQQKTPRTQKKPRASIKMPKIPKQKIRLPMPSGRRTTSGGTMGIVPRGTIGTTSTSELSREMNEATKKVMKESGNAMNFAIFCCVCLFFFSLMMAMLVLFSV